MTLEILKTELIERSFWHVDSQSALLPEQNLPRLDLLAGLSALDSSNLVTCIMGQRRCGKSVIVRQYIQQLWAEGIPPHNILYINFFLRPLKGLQDEKIFAQIIDWWMKDLVDKNKRSYLLLDEVHLLEHWDENVASIFEDPKFPCRIIMTGSNSSLLSKDLSTKLGGRFTSLPIFPFSWSEYCRFTNQDLNLKSIESYLFAGGLPEVLKLKNSELAAQLVGDIVNSIVKNDIVERYNPSNPRVLFSLIEYCRQSYGQDLSLTKIQNEINSRLSIPQNPQANRKSTTLAETYLQYMVDAYFLYCPQTYSYRIKDVLKQKVDKIYLSDLSFADHDSGVAKGRLLENMVYLEINRRHFKIKRFLGYRNKNLEIDFWVKNARMEALIQVCWQLGSPEENGAMWDREFGNLGAVSWDVPKIVVSLDAQIKSPVKGVQHLSVQQFFEWLDNNR